MLVLLSMVGFGLDSLLAGLIVGSLLRSWRERLGLALAFGAFDSAAALAGTAWPHRAPEAHALAAYLLFAALLAVAARYNRALFYLLPLILSVDNFFGQVRDNPLAMGVNSALLALLGLSLAAFGRNLFLASQPEA